MSFHLYQVTNVHGEKFFLKYAMLSNIKNIIGFDLIDSTEKKLSVGLGQSNLIKEKMRRSKDISWNQLVALDFYLLFYS